MNAYLVVSAGLSVGAIGGALYAALLHPAIMRAIQKRRLRSANRYPARFIVRCATELDFEIFLRAVRGYNLHVEKRLKQ